VVLSKNFRNGRLLSKKGVLKRLVVARRVPFLYRTSPRPFNEEVDFFYFLVDTGKKREKEHGIDGGFRTNDGAGSFGTNDGAGSFGTPTLVLKPTMLEVDAPNDGARAFGTNHGAES